MEPKKTSPYILSFIVNGEYELYATNVDSDFVNHIVDSEKSTNDEYSVDSIYDAIKSSCNEVNGLFINGVPIGLEVIL